MILWTEAVIFINIEKALQNAETLRKITGSSSIFFKSLTLLKFSKDNIIRKIIFIAVEGFAASVIVQQYLTIPITKEIAGILISIIISLIAIVFTGYAFFQALINDRLLIALLSVDSKKNANLAKTNEYFAEVMTDQITCLIVDFAVAAFSIIMPNDWCLFSNNAINEILAFGALLFFFYINIESIWEMRSFVYNVYQLYNLHAYSRILEIKENSSHQNETNKPWQYTNVTLVDEASLSPRE